jgi:hypothetical protein
VQGLLRDLPRFAQTIRREYERVHIERNKRLMYLKIDARILLASLGSNMSYWIGMRSTPSSADVFRSTS